MTDRARFWKCFPAIVAILAVLAAPSHRSQAADSEIRFVNWASAEVVTRNTINEVIEAFEAENSGIRVENVAIPFGQIRTQIITMVAGGNAPDVMQVSGSLPFELAGMSALADLTKYAGQEYIDDNWEGPIDASRYGGQLINVPWAVTPFGFWYNKSLMRRAGIASPARSWGEFQNQLDAVKRELGGQGIDAFELFTAKAGYGVVHNWSLMWAFGAYPLENNRAGLSTPEMKNYFRWLRSMIADRYTTGGFKLREFREELAKGRLVFGFDGPYVQGMIKSLNRDITDENINDIYGVTALPAGVSGEAQIALDFHGLAMAKRAKNKEAAWRFIRFLTSSSVAIEKYLLPMGSILPLRSSVARYSEVFETPINKAFIDDVLPAVRSMPYSPKWGRSAQHILNAIQRVCFTDEPIDRIADHLNRTVSAIYGW